jgi:hypothetical protein
MFKSKSHPPHLIEASVQDQEIRIMRKTKKREKIEVKADPAKGTEDQHLHLKEDTKATKPVAMEATMSKKMKLRRIADITGLGLTPALSPSLNLCQSKNNFILMEGEETARRTKTNSPKTSPS